MFWARLLIFGIPLALAGLTWWSAGQVRASRMSDSGEVVAVLPGNPPALHPFVPATEVDRQIVDLIYEPLIRIGPDGRLQPALAERWDWSQTITCWFLKDDQAANAADHLKNISADKWIEWGLDSVTPEGSQLAMRFSKMNGTGPEQVLSELAVFEPLPIEIVRVELAELANPYHEHFMANAVEASQVKRVWFDGENAYELVVSGNVAKFIEEITNYYNAKANLTPRIRSMNRIPALQEPALDLLLREGTRWHDGSLFTADDVKATFAGVMKQPWPVPNREALRQVLSLETIGSSKVRIVYRKRFGPAICGWVNLPILPARWLRDHAADPEGRVFTESVAPGTGLFEVTHRDLASLALAPSASAWADFRVTRLSFLSGASPFRTRLAFATGAVDMFWPENGAVTELLENQGLAIRSMPPRSRLLVLWNTRSPVVSDPKVREALALATDREALIRELLDGRGRTEDGLFQPGLWFAQKFAPPRYDPESAERLLREAGWLRDVEGITRRPGQSFTIELLTTAGNPQRLQLAEALATQWRKIGVQATITTLPWQELVDQRVAPHQFDAAILGLDFETSWDQLPFWHSSQIAEGLNFSGIADRQIDLLLEALRDEFDPDHVPPKARELENAILALHPILPLFTDMTQIAVRLGALPPGAPVDDPSPWTLRSLVYNRREPSQAIPAAKMLMPREESGSAPPTPNEN